LFAVYKQSFNMAYDMAKKAEKCYQYEIGNELASFVQYGYWDNSYQGLLAGEKLQQALRQMEKSYLEENKRELELRKNVSLALLNPLALQELRQTGKCYITIPEEMFDMDFQGHYFRRLKSVSMSIPCIAGPLTTISCTLRLLKNSIRTNTSMNDDGNYEHMNDEGVWIDDDRFRSSNVPVQSIAVTNGQSDPGLFELNFRDERYLPFEGAGAISDWKIELTMDEELRQFDYSTISDIIMHLSYTAREDAGLFKDKAVTYIKSYLTNAAELSTQPLMRMFSMRHEFSTEWYRFLNPLVAGDDQVIKLTLRKEHFPFFTRDRNVDVMQVDILAKTNRSGDYHLMMTSTDTGATVMTSTQISMPENATYANMQKATLTGVTANISVEDINAFAELTMKFKHSTDANYHSLDDAEMQDVFMVIHYKLS
jgi:Tc toxin complex TcA C-terminal TcB-binding domain